MRRKIVSVLLCSAFCLLGIDGYAVKELSTDPEPQAVVQVEEPVTMAQEMAKSRKSPEVVIVTVETEVERQPETVLTDEEKRLVACVVWAEAGNQDMIGKRLVADTVLNRVGRPGFAGTVQGVIYQPYQFAYRGYFTPECMEAVEKECFERLDYNVLWFRTGSFHSYGVPAYQHGDHYFNWAVNDEQTL